MQLVETFFSTEKSIPGTDDNDIFFTHPILKFQPQLGSLKCFWSFFVIPLFLKYFRRNKTAFFTKIILAEICTDHNIGF
jgi:hypothetical protein